MTRTILKMNKDMRVTLSDIKIDYRTMYQVPKLWK